MKLTRRRFLAAASAAVTAACDDSVNGTPPTPDATPSDDAASQDVLFQQDAISNDAPSDASVPADLPAPEDTSAPADVPAPEDIPALEDIPAPIDVSAPEDIPAPVDASAPADVLPAPDLPAPADVPAPVDAPSLDATMMLPELGTLFPMGLMAGDMDTTSAVLWTRYVGRASLAVRVERMEGGRPVETTLERDVTPGPDGYTHVLAPSLRPGARYRVVFLTRDGGSPTGRSPAARFRAALAPDALEPVVFGATSCTNALYRPFAPLQRVGDQGELDFFVHLGDMAYCDGSRTIEQFRARYAENFASEGFRRMLTAAGLYSTWDDHEVDNNFNPERTDAAVIATARRAFFESRAARRDPADPDRIWRSFRWGATLELFILDCRGERRPSTRTSRDAVYLSRAQMDWLKQGLERSTARFKVIANSVPVADFPITFLGGDDRWEGYAAARNEVLDHITGRNIRGVWWLSGDFHLGCVGRLQSSGARANMRDILAGPGGQFPNPLFLSLLPPQFDFTTGENNYVMLRADPARNELQVRFINGAGRVIFDRTYANP